MDMPDIVNNYFDADSRSDVDENARHHGIVAIRGWWVAAKKATQYRAEPVEFMVEGDKALFRARVSGHFPGSPVMLTHDFTIKDDRIVRLEIRS